MHHYFAMSWTKLKNHGQHVHEERNQMTAISTKISTEDSWGEIHRPAARYHE